MQLQDIAHRLTKIDKSITSKLHSIIQKCITKNIDANTIIEKLNNIFLNAQQMVALLNVYFVLSLPLYHSF
jgi:predicted transcriptional regulator